MKPLLSKSQTNDDEDDDYERREISEHYHYSVWIKV